MLSLKTKERLWKIDMVTFLKSHHTIRRFFFLQESKSDRFDFQVTLGKPQGLYTFPMTPFTCQAPPAGSDHVCGEIIKPEGLDVEAELIEKDGAEYLFIIDKDVITLQRGIPGFDSATDETLRDSIRLISIIYFPKIGILT